ncbi:MAG: hypothetical protein P1Q69_06145 [Candidatus Thorarchaeota archaeon]|nr:hypothetical protein [Candidatus Thorarchaeota archaeon]
MAFDPFAFLIAAAIVMGGTAFVCCGLIWICIRDRKKKRDSGVVW